MLRKLLLSLVAATSLCTANAEEIELKEGAPNTYVVQRGDTLWDIAGMYLDQPWLWPRLWRINPQINNPHLIYPGDVIALVYDEHGQPMLVVSSADGSPTVTDADGNLTVDSGGGTTTAFDPNKRVVKISPTARKSLKKDTAIPTLPLRFIRPYLTFEQIMEQDDIQARPYVLGANHNIKYMASGYTIFVKGRLERDQFYAIYNIGKPYMDQETDEILGYRAILTATGRATQVGDPAAGSPSALEITSAHKEIRQGDIVLPSREGQLLPAFFSLIRPEGFSARIIDTSTNIREVGRYDIIVIDQGAADDVKVGHFVDIMRDSPQVIDSDDGPVYIEEANAFTRAFSEPDSAYTMDEASGAHIAFPREKIGEAVIFKVYENMSYAMIMDTTYAVRIGDYLETPE